MTTKPMISVIIPFYNEYNYLENTIMSVLFQSYKNLEILIVDDSGVHGARDIVKAIKDKRVRLLDYGINRGVSAARNFGLDNAHGDWVYFLDSDDFISSNFLERCISAAQYSKLPVVGIVRHIHTKDSQIVEMGSNSSDFAVFPMQTNCGAAVLTTHHLHLYSKQFLDSNKIRFCEGLIFGEDLLFYMSVAHYARFECLTGGALYYFRFSKSDKPCPYTSQDCKKWADTKQKFEAEYSKILKLYEPGFKHPEAEQLIKEMTALSQKPVSWGVRLIACFIPIKKWRRKFRNQNKWIKK